MQRSKGDKKGEAVLDMYIYVLKLVKDDDFRYYVGKTKNLYERIKNHYNRNRKAADLTKSDGYRVLSVERLYKIDLSNSSEPIDACTSKIESFVAQRCINEWGYERVRGGCFLDTWGDDTEVPQLFEYDYQDFIVEDQIEAAHINQILGQKRPSLSINLFK